MLGRLAVPKTLQILGKILTQIILRDPLDPRPNSPAEFFVQKLFMAHFRLWKMALSTLQNSTCQKENPSSSAKMIKEKRQRTNGFIFTCVRGAGFLLLRKEKHPTLAHRLIFCHPCGRVCPKDTLGFHYVESKETTWLCPLDKPGVVPRATGPKVLCFWALSLSCDV